MKILILHPHITPPGGGEAVGAWALHALQDRHDVTLATIHPPDFENVNRFYGTSIDPARIRLVLLPGWLRTIAELPPTRGDLFKSAIHYRWARRLIADSDLAFSTWNEWDFGKPGMQYIHYPRMNLPRPEYDLRWYHFGAGTVALYTWLCLRLGGVREPGVQANLTLANSAWTARAYAARHEREAEVLYPPVPGGFPEARWEDRARRFLCVGRISPEKRVEDAIEILRRVRGAGEEVGLDLVGAPVDPRYARGIEELVRRNSDWIAWHRYLPREDYARLLSSARFGIHAMAGEHFGIAVAEFLRAGCVPVVPSSGGVVEIVGGDPRLTFTSIEEGAARILDLLRSPETLEEVRRTLEPRRGLFTEERFVAGLRAAVDRFAGQMGR